MSKMSTPPPPAILHERNLQGQHRLVLLRSQVPQVSRWFEPREVGFFRGIYFHVGAAGPTVPEVFRVTQVTHEELA